MRIAPILAVATTAAVLAAASAASAVVYQTTIPLGPQFSQNPNLDLTNPAGGTFTPSGSADVTLDTDANLLSFTLDWQGLSTPVGGPGIHLHGVRVTEAMFPVAANDGTSLNTAPIVVQIAGATMPPAVSANVNGTGGPLALPLPTADAVSGTFDLTNLAPSLGFAAPSDFVNSLLGDDRGVGFYFNIHTEQNPMGEIRGNVVGLTAVPEPASAALLLVPAAALLRRRRA